MRFGKSRTEAEKEPAKGGSGTDFIKYLREGSTTFRIIDEPKDWTYYWEHFSPHGFSFACNDTDPDNPQPEDCPGCSSDNEKMKKPSRKIAFNVLESYNGQDYVRVYKIGPMVADKLDNRYKRLDTLTDRDYTITKYKTGGDRWDFDVEGNQKVPVDLSKFEKKDVEKMLYEQWLEHWGEGAPEQPAEAPPARRPTIAPVVKSEDPPFEQEKVYQEADLREMDPSVLLSLLQTDMGLVPPSTVQTTDQMVDWLMELQSS